jgi:hypothetical protein
MRGLTLGLVVAGTIVSASAFTAAPAAAQGATGAPPTIDRNGPVRQQGFCRKLAQPGQTNGTYVWLPCESAAPARARRAR